MANVNKVTLIGRLGNDPELRYAGSSVITELRIAVNRTWTDKSGAKQEKTDWFGVEVWGKQAENACNYLSKGREVYVDGRLATDEWTDKDSGQKRTKVKIVADNWQFIGSNHDANRSGDGDRQYDYGKPPGDPELEGEVPF